MSPFESLATIFPCSIDTVGLSNFFNSLLSTFSGSKFSFTTSCIVSSEPDAIADIGFWVTIFESIILVWVITFKSAYNVSSNICLASLPTGYSLSILALYEAPFILK